MVGKGCRRAVAGRKHAIRSVSPEEAGADACALEMAAGYGEEDGEQINQKNSTKKADAPPC